jgi:transcriptional regulator GlxA family with amidase domain
VTAPRGKVMFSYCRHPKKRKEQRREFCFFLLVQLMMMMMMMILIMITMLRAAVHLRTTSLLVTDSCCRGGIVHSRCGCSCARIERPESPKTIWRFHASTSNSSSGRTWLHTHTHLRQIYHTYAQQGIRVCGDDHCEPPKRQSKNPNAL